jgi:hypothetical protein
VKCASRWRSEVESHSYTVAYGAEDSSVRSDTVASHLSQVGPGYCAVEGRTRGYCGVEGHIHSINHTYPLYPLSLSLSPHSSFSSLHSSSSSFHHTSHALTNHHSCLRFLQSVSYTLPSSVVPSWLSFSACSGTVGSFLFCCAVVLLCLSLLA